MFPASLNIKQHRLPAFKALSVLPAYREASKKVMIQEASTHPSPKRKRDESAILKKPSPSRLRTTFTAPAAVEDESSAESPRTQVSNRFEGLQLEGTFDRVDMLDPTGAMPQLDDGMDDIDKVKKKSRVSDDAVFEIPETPQALGTRTEEELLYLNSREPIIFKGVSDLKKVTGKLSKSYPSINRLSDSVSRVKKRPGTPPAKSAVDDLAMDADFTDPDRASLTWHDNEITGFDPDDPDDDGEGIDGVGFRQSAARVELRQRKKRQQLADYRSRLNKEARAKRFEKRTGSLNLSSSGGEEDAEALRKVRFSEGSSNVMFAV